MTQITQEQREHFEAVAVQATAKLEVFRDGLTADERAILSLGLWQAVAEAAGTDESVAGFEVNTGARNPLINFARDYLIGKGLDILFENFGYAMDIHARTRLPGVHNRPY